MPPPPIPPKRKSAPYTILPRRLRQLNILRQLDLEPITEIENTSVLESENIKENQFTTSIENIRVNQISESESESNYNMATNENNVILTTTDLFNSLRVPDAIKDLPRFDGNPRLLFDFLDNVKEILSIISVTDGTPYGQLLLRAIRNKIVGEANEVLNMYGTPLDWEQIRQNLILHYSDKRNETSLIRDLHGLRQNNDTVQKFYSNIIELLSSMTTHVNIHEVDPNVIAAKKSLFAEMCLNTFLSGLKEPLGSTIRAMKPVTLAAAYACCIQEQNIFYTKSDPNKQFSNLNPFNNSKPRPQNSEPIVARSMLPQFRIQPSVSNPRPTYQPYTFFPQKPFLTNPQAQPAFINNNQRFNNSNQNANRGQFMNPINNNFRPTPFQNSFNPQFRQPTFGRSFNNTQPKPEPMETSGITRRTQSQLTPQMNRFFNPQPTPRYTAQELFNITEQNPENDYSYGVIYPEEQLQFQPYYQAPLQEFSPMDHSSQIIEYPCEPLSSNPESNPYITNVEVDDENFQSSASTDQSDT